MICTINADGEFVTVSAASQTVWGYSPEELNGSKFMNLVYHEDADITLKAAEKIVNGIPVPTFENRYVHKSGRVVPLLWSVNWDEKLQLMFCIAKDITEKKRLEKAIENERDQFYHMFLKAPSAIGMLKGANHVFEMANPLYLQLTGKKDIIGKTVAEVLPEVIEQGFVSLLDHVYQTGESYTGTEMLVKVDTEGNGELTDFYMNFVYQAYRNGEGEIEGVFFFINDITEQIASRKKIEKSEKFFKGVIENSDDMITILDGTGKTIYASPAVSKKFGYTAAETLELNVMDVIHPDDIAVMGTFIAEILRHPSLPMPCPVVRERKKDGSYIWVEGTLTNFLETEGINAIVANFRDVTERKKAEEEIRDSEEKRRLIMSGALDAIICIDTNDSITFWNPQAEVIFGWKEEEVMGRELSNLIVPEAFRRYHTEGIKHYLETGVGKAVNVLLELKAIRRSGKEFPIELTVLPIKQGAEVFFCAFIRDVTERKRSEDKNRFKVNLLNTIGQAAVATDMNGIVSYWNNAAKQIYGWTQEEAIGKNIIDLTPSKATKEQALQIMEKLKQGHQWSGEFRVQRKDGTDFPAWVTDAPIYDEHQNLTGIIGISSDITEKKKLEELLDKSNRLARIGSWEIDVDKGTVFWSDIIKEIREAEPDFIPDLSTGIGFFTEGMNKKIISQRVQQCIDNGIPWDEELQLTTFKGNVKWVRTIGEAEFVQGKCSKVYGSFQDITERKTAADKVIRSETKLKVAQHIAQVGSWEVDMLTNEHSWSDEFYRILGIYEDVRPAYETFLSSIHPDDRAIAVSTMEDAFSIYADSSFHFRFIRKNGEIGYASSEWKFEFNSHRNPLYIYGILRDLTKEKKAESERVKMISDIVQRNRGLEQFTFIISHNLRAPAANIIGCAKFLQDETLTPLEQKEFLQGLYKSVTALDAVIKDLNNILQVKSEVNEKKEVIIFSKLANDIMISIGNLIDKHRVRIISDFSEVDEIYSLKVYMHSIFYNLISNSIKYSKPDEQPLIEITSKKENGKITLTFKDNGLGIDMKTKGDKIFGLYNRFHSHVEGKGMGLFMVKTQVESLGGKIAIQSEPDKGTEFIIVFEN